MEKFKALANKKIAGVPVLAFVALFGAGILWYALKMKPAPEEEVVTDANAPGGDANTLASDSKPIFSVTPATAIGQAGSTVTQTQTTDTNELYAKRLMDYMLNVRNDNYNDAKMLVDDWLFNHRRLDWNQDNIRNGLIKEFGLPPEPLPFVPVWTQQEWLAVQAEGRNPRLLDYPDAGGNGSANKAPYSESAAATSYDSGAADSYGSYESAYSETPVPVPSVPQVPSPSSTRPPAKPVKQGTPPLVHVVRGNGDTNYRDIAMLYFQSNAFDLVQRIKAQDRNLKWKDGPFPVGTHIKVPTARAHFFVATNTIRSANAIAAKNGINAQQLQIMNPNTKFPVNVGTRVQVG